MEAVGEGGTRQAHAACPTALVDDAVHKVFIKQLRHSALACNLPTHLQPVCWRQRRRRARQQSEPHTKGAPAGLTAPVEAQHAAEVRLQRGRSHPHADRGGGGRLLWARHQMVDHRPEASRPGALPEAVRSCQHKSAGANRDGQLAGPPLLAGANWRSKSNCRCRLAPCNSLHVIVIAQTLASHVPRPCTARVWPGHLSARRASGHRRFWVPLRMHNTEQARYVARAPRQRSGRRGNTRAPRTGSLSALSGMPAPTTAACVRLCLFPAGRRHTWPRRRRRRQRHARLCRRCTPGAACSCGRCRLQRRRGWSGWGVPGDAAQRGERAA